MGNKPENNDSTYELFILTLAVLSLTVLPLLYLPLWPGIQRLLFIFSGGVSLIFLADFFRSLYRAPRKLTFLKWGWLDFLGSTPTYPLLHLARIARIVRAVRILRQIRGREMRRQFFKRRAQSTFLVTAFITIVIVGFSSLAVLQLESRVPEANITTSEDALWWAFVSLTTVGYGDRFPVTSLGRAIAVVLLTVGVGLFGVFTSYLASWFISPTEGEQEDEMARLRADIATIKTELATIKQLLQERDQPP